MQVAVVDTRAQVQQVVQPLLVEVVLLLVMVVVLVRTKTGRLEQMD
jgi:hypothetical protein